MGIVQTMLARRVYGVYLCSARDQSCQPGWAVRTPNWARQRFGSPAEGSGGPSQKPRRGNATIEGMDHDGKR